MDRSIRKTTIILLLLGAMQADVHATSSSFAMGNSAYERGDIGHALEQYRAIAHKGSAVWYNMGNCYYHQQEGAQAIVCWQRSIPGSSYAHYIDVHNNIGQATRSLGLEWTTDSFTPFFNGIAYTTPVWIMQWLTLIFWFCLWLAIRYRYNIRFFYLLFFGILVATLFSGLVVYKQWSNERYQTGIVVAKNTTLLAGPNKGYHGVADVAYGDTLDLIEQRPGWYKVAKNGTCGWVTESAIELIESVS